MSDDKEFITLDEAVKRLPDASMVHTFRRCGPLLLGAHHEREQLIADMAKAPHIEVTGHGAQRMNHGLAVHDQVGVLFIETRVNKEAV